MPVDPSGWKQSSFGLQLKHSLDQHNKMVSRRHVLRPREKKVESTPEPALTKNNDDRPSLLSFRRVSSTEKMAHMLGDAQKMLCVRTEEKDEDTVTTESTSSDEEDDVSVKNFDEDFESCFTHEEMRCLALVAHNHMKPAMKDFVLSNKKLLRKFRLTGTGTTMKMLSEVFGEEHMKKHGGPVCKSGPLGGDAELVAQMCAENLGAVIFFQDPMDAHPHTPDIDCLNRQANVHNIITCPNTSSAHALTFTLRTALKMGEMSIIPSFFYTLESPSVGEYKRRQAAVLEAAKKS